MVAAEADRPREIPSLAIPSRSPGQRDRIHAHGGTLLRMLATTKQLMTRKEAAEALSISLRKLEGLIKSGDIPVVKIGAATRVRPSALEYFIEARETRGNRKGKGGAR